MKRSSAFRALTFTSLAFLLAGCWWNEAAADVQALEKVGTEIESSSVLRDPAQARSDIRTMLAGGKSDFSSSEWQRVIVYSQMNSEVQRWSTSATLRIAFAAPTISTSATWVTGASEKLQSITQEALKGYVCASVRDYAFPNSDPAKNAADANWSGLSDEFIQAAKNEFAASSGYDPNIVAWLSWYDNITKTGNQIAQNLLARRTFYASLLAKPGVRRAAIAYVKYCLSPP